MVGLHRSREGRYSLSKILLRSELESNKFEDVKSSMTDLYMSENDLALSISPEGHLVYQKTLTTVCIENLYTILLSSPR